MSQSGFNESDKYDRLTDHDEIRNWVEERGGRPAKLAEVEAEGEEIGLLRIEFPDIEIDANLESISWEEFFDKFEESQSCSSCRSFQRKSF